MTARMKWLRVGALLLFTAASAEAQSLQRSSPEAVGMVSSRIARIDSVMQGVVDSSRAAGVAVMVIRDGRTVKLEAYGWADREAGRHLQTDALFRIASQTKAVTSVAVMMLVETGRLRLTDAARQWVPSLGDATVTSDGGAQPVRRPITIRDLLTHAAGVSYGTEPSVRASYEQAGLGPALGYGWYFADKSERICESVDRIGNLPFVSQPGDRFVYGYSTDILGCIVERVSGQSLDQFFQARIFQPLGMRDTHFFVPADQRARLTTVYAVRNGRLERAPDGALGQGSYAEGPRLSYSGGAGLISTITDYARFLQMLLNGGELDDVRLLSPHSIAMMSADHLGDTYGRAGLGFGLGFEILTNPGLAGRYGGPGAYGWGGAYATTYWIDPSERLVGLIMTQTLPSGGLDAADRFRTLVYAAIERSARLEH
jgi:CubicO group peptidase (beta-lactamase class C family)